MLSCEFASQLSGMIWKLIFLQLLLAYPTKAFVLTITPLLSKVSKVAGPLISKLPRRQSQTFSSTVYDAPPQSKIAEAATKKKIKFNITPVKWVDLMSVVSLRVNTFYPELCNGAASNESMKKKIMNKMIMRGNEGSMNFMAQEEGGFFYRNLIGAVEVSPSDFRGSIMESIGAQRKLYLVDLCIREGFRKMGIASSLLSAVEEYALENQFMEIYMHVEASNIVACNLYAKNGYSVVPTCEWAIKFTEFRLKKPADGYLLLVKNLST